MNKGIPGSYKQRKYFSSIRGYTLALLNAFNNIKYWVPTDGTEEDETQKEYTVPISFGNYDKSIMLNDLSEKDITQGNFNFLPRLVLSFEGVSKAPDRQTNKFNKYSKKVTGEDGHVSMDFSWNSVSYDFHFTLLLQTRGLTIASMIMEETLVKFNPTLNLMIKEFPIFKNRTETQILISDPAFEIMSEFAEEEVNVVNVTMDITVRGNIYSNIEMQGPIKVVKMFNNVWALADIESANLASYYRFDVNPKTHKVIFETSRIFDATALNTPTVETPDEQELIEKRPDYYPPQHTQEVKDGEYVRRK